MSLLDSYSRRGYVERRIAEALVAQEETARVAQTAMLENAVPRHAILPLREWCRQAYSPDYAVSSTFAVVTIAHIELLHFPAPQDATSLGWITEAHRAVDSVIDSCVYVTKIKTAGTSVLLGGPFHVAADEGFGDDGRSSAQTLAAATVADVIFVAKSLVQLGARLRAGVHVGAAAGAVLGTERLSYDVVGEAANTARFIGKALGSSKKLDKLARVVGSAQHPVGADDGHCCVPLRAGGTLLGISRGALEALRILHRPPSPGAPTTADVGPIAASPASSEAGADGGWDKTTVTFARRLLPAASSRDSNATTTNPSSLRGTAPDPSTEELLDVDFACAPVVLANRDAGDDADDVAIYIADRVLNNCTQQPPTSTGANSPRW
jgi:class 3 adenylate cyclase